MSAALSPATTPTHAQLVVDRLNLEWAEMEDHRRPAAWKQVPGLAPCITLGHVYEHLRDGEGNSTRTGSAEAALLVLLEAFQDGHDPLAGRVVLQRFLGRAVSLCRRAYRPRDCGVRGKFADLMDIAVASVWDAIATYPVARRRTKVGANLAMEALARFTAAVRLIDGPDAPGALSDLPDGAPGPEEAVETGLGPLSPSVWGPDPGVELLSVLAWGIDAGVISGEEASLLTRVYCPAPDQPGGSAVAFELGISWVTVRKRCSRAIKRLAVAVQAVDA